MVRVTSDSKESKNNIKDSPDFTKKNFPVIPGEMLPDDWLHLNEDTLSGQRFSEMSRKYYRYIRMDGRDRLLHTVKEQEFRAIQLVFPRKSSHSINCSSLITLGTLV